jgi:hypothetical protein
VTPPRSRQFFLATLLLSGLLLAAGCQSPGSSIEPSPQPSTTVDRSVDEGTEDRPRTSESSSSELPRAPRERTRRDPMRKQW